MIPVYEISGQCAHCHDFFTISLSYVSGQPKIVTTPRLQWVGPDLVHRPGLCNGKVTLYGELPLDPTSHHELPATGPAPTD
jgi:hypothetical protein